MAEPTGWDLFSRILGIAGGAGGLVSLYYTLKKNWKTRVIIKADLRLITYVNRATNERNDLPTPMLYVEVVNHLDHEITVAGIIFSSSKKGQSHALVPHINDPQTQTQWSLPVVVKAHASQGFPIPWPWLSQMPQFDGAGAQVVVNCSTGETFKGPRLKRELTKISGYLGR